MPRTLIIKARLIEAAGLTYVARGKVVRVFDENAAGDLLPVEFDRQEESSAFQLRRAPSGPVRAEVVIGD
jgi:hypothetical protein